MASATSAASLAAVAPLPCPAASHVRATILLVEQNASAVLDVRDHAHVLQTGDIVLSGAVAEVANSLAVAACYLGDQAGAWPTELSYDYHIALQTLVLPAFNGSKSRIPGKR